MTVYMVKTHNRDFPHDDMAGVGVRGRKGERGREIERSRKIYTPLLQYNKRNARLAASGYGGTGEKEVEWVLKKPLLVSFPSPYCFHFFIEKYELD